MKLSTYSAAMNLLGGTALNPNGFQKARLGWRVWLCRDALEPYAPVEVWYGDELVAELYPRRPLAPPRTITHPASSWLARRFVRRNVEGGRS